MSALYAVCLLLIVKGIEAQICGYTSPCMRQAYLPIPSNIAVDNSVVQSLVDTIQLCVVSGALQNNLNAPKAVKIPLASTPVLPGVNCKQCRPEITCVDELMPVISCDVPYLSPTPCLDKYLDSLCKCSCNPCTCNPCNCKKSCKECLEALICGSCSCKPCSCPCNPCGCKKPCQDLILPPLVPQLPCGCGYLPAAAPLVTSAYGAYESCISPLGSCAEAYIPGAIPVIEPLFPCGCGLCNYGCSPCTSATISTPFCHELTRLAQPIIL